MGALEGQEELFFSDLLKQFRRRKKLTQRQLAGRLEVTRETVSLWERGNYKPDDEVMLYEIVNVLSLTDQEQARLFEAYTVTALATSFHHPPAKRNPYFTGRSAQLSQLHTLLSAGKQVALTQAISGLGGIGKTQLALEYAYRYQKSYHDIFWASADTEEALMASYIQFAEALRLSEVEEADQNKVKAAVCRWFQQHTNWLLICDNIEDLHLLPSFVPENRQGAVLLTTRRQVTEPAAQTLELAVLSEDEAVLFLLKRTKVLPLDASLEDASDNEVEAARAITRLLDNLPLALDQAGAYILETRCSFAEYGMLFQTHRDHLLQRRIGESIPTDHPDSVTTTFELNFQQVQQRNAAAADLLRLCAYLAPDAIAEEILTEGASLLGLVLSPVAADTFLLNQAMESLRAYSLIRRDPEGKLLSIHRLVQAVLQDQQDPAERRIWTERAVQAVNAAFPHMRANKEYEAWAQCERLLLPALVAIEYIEQDQMMFEEAGRLLSETAVYLQGRARYGEAEPLCQRALSIRERLFGAEHPEVASSLKRLAILYYEQGKYEAAEPLYQQALSIWERLGGLEHSEVASSLNNLAILYSEQGKYEAAEPLYQQALSIWEQRLGPEHPDVAYPLNNLASLYKEQGKYEAAEPLYRRALHIREQRWGPEHPLMATPLHGLANLYLDQGKYAEAEPLYRRVLHIREQSLGPEHPQVTYPLTNLAELYKEQGKYEQAELLYQRALSIWEQQLGLKHPEIAYPLHGLASVSYRQGKYEQAELLYQKALSIREQQGEPEHPLVAEILHDLAALREQQRNYQEALALLERALAIRERALGPEHPKTGATRERLTTLKQSISQEAGASPQDGLLPEQHE
ncbi:MAG TPA: FxSxx-COOH system tetratricopeptide repeat protein [Ktedonobacteraceae bacterium]|nr:FxSxx-COOH system tetratricopeptide repeat protein [Ktedonobacteraceae bacterium]